MNWIKAFWAALNDTLIVSKLMKENRELAGEIVVLKEDVAKYKKITEQASLKAAGFGSIVLGAVRQCGQAPNRMIISAGTMQSVKPEEIARLKIKQTDLGGVVVTAPKEA